MGWVEGSVWDPGNEGCEGQSWECPQPVMDGKSFGNGEEKFRVRGGNEGLGFDSWLQRGLGCARRVRTSSGQR